MNKNTKNRNFSENQTIECLSSTQMLKCEDNDKLNIEDLENICNYFYEDNFHNILLKSKFWFLNSIENKIQEVIKYHFDDNYINSSFFRRTINKYKKALENKYLKDFSYLNEQYSTNINEIKDNERTYIFKFLRHCINSEECAYHPCSSNKKGKFILIQGNSNPFINNSLEFSYVICLQCKRCYKSTCFNTICLSCNKEYYSSILKENEDNNIVLATWEKYHCGGVLTDHIMKCIKCKKELYLNLLTNKLICLNKNCNFEAKSQSILWKCIFCSKEFRSKAKVYNPLEFQVIKKAINFTLLMKLKASPLFLPCCKKEINDLIFYHKEECKGILFKGYLKGKEILVCKKCHAMNFIDKFNWICPLCGKKFHSYHSKSLIPSKKNDYNSNNKNKDDENNNDVNNNNKMPTRIFLKKEYSSTSFKKEQDMENEDKNNSNNKKNEKLNMNNMYYIADKYLNSVGNSSNSNSENKDIYIKINQKNNSRNNLIKNNISTEKYDINRIKKKKNRTTLFEVLEKRKKNSLDGNPIRNISIKKTIDSVLIDNINKTKNMDEKNSDVIKKNIIFLDKESSNNNNNIINNKRIENAENKNIKNEKYIVNRNLELGKNSILNKNIILTNYMNSYDDLSKKKNLTKCRSSNMFKGSNNNSNNIKSETSNKNNENHQTNYLYTTNSNYNIKVSLNINNNICPYSQNEEKNNDNSKNEKMFPNDGLNQIKEIYLQEILKNTGINLDNVINNNIENIIASVNSENESNEIEVGKKYSKYNNNLNKNKLYLDNLSPERIDKKITKQIFTKNDCERRTENIKNIIEFYPKSIKNKNNRNPNKFKNSGIKKIEFPSQIQKNQGIINNNINYNSEQNNNNKEPKKLFLNKFIYFNKNKIEKSKNLINTENEEIDNEENQKYSNNSGIDKLKKIQEDKNENIEDKIIENSLNKNKENIKINIYSMKNVIVSPEMIDQLTKESKIPIFKDTEYKYIRPIGEGSYGLIYLVENCNKKHFALKKILCKDLYEIYKHKNQLELIYSMNHSNILEIYNIQYKYLDSTTYAIYVLMERAQNDWSVDIRKRIINKNPYKEEEIISILKQVVSGLSYLQRKNITHRDIKPQNILLFKGNIFKVADLGEAKTAENKSQEMTLRGSELYMSPLLYEKYKSNKKSLVHNPYKSDVFSLGFSCLYAMNLNLNVIENIREFKKMKIIINSIKKKKKKNIYSDKLKQIIFKMIEIEEDKRYDFVELENQLNNNFINNIY